ncbi:HAD-like protein [Lentithecium fluviatile CBS 122367]|uniref:HAD-like protein n=1 Tax=Lentithecium fluviatile CBS 122367 TaxID=1168545 RepID=A0A6G1IR60_9PLEO|nr:HAD-like protein [Lentithecium fluviatile CBS 122367]
MPLQRPLEAVIFDLGDVLFTWSAETKTNVPSTVLRQILSSNTWFEYERGHITREGCFEKVAHEFSLNKSQVEKAFKQAHQSLRPDEVVVAFLKDLRSDGKLKVYAMSNIGKEDFADLEHKIDWSLFDGVYASGDVGMRKPDPEFFRYVLDNIKIAPDRVMFVDDKQENVASAESLGINSFVFNDLTIVDLKRRLNDPYSKGLAYLHQNAQQFNSITSNGISIPDNFAKLLILEATGDSRLVKLPSSSASQEGTWNFFTDRTATLVTGGYFPDDLDTTSLALMVQPPTQSDMVNLLLDRMAQNVQPDGSILIYFDEGKLRTDAVVSSNVLACFYRYNRGQELAATLQHVCGVLSKRSYLQGTRYYPSADCCLGFFGRLLESAPNDSELQAAVRPLLKECVREHVGKSGTALELAMRIILCDALGLGSGNDLQTLIGLQLLDGSWEAGWMYRYGSTGVRIGNQGLTTALALKAIASAG